MNPFRKLLISGAIVGTTIAGGALGAAFVSGVAGADSATTTAAAATAPAAAQPGTPPAPGQAPRGGQPAGPHQANGKTEAALTGDDLAKATAAANKAVPGGTVVRAETDADGDVYEVHMTKADGSQVTVKLDAGFNVTKVADGMA